MMVVDMLVVIMVLVLVIIQTNRQESSTLHLKLLDGGWADQIYWCSRFQKLRTLNDSE